MSGVTAAGVGKVLGVSADTVRRHWSTWSSTKGFPRPLFGEDSMLRWDEQAVTDWKVRRSNPIAAGELEPDWAAIARARGAALDRGEDPDVVCV